MSDLERHERTLRRIGDLLRLADSADVHEAAAAWNRAEHLVEALIEARVDEALEAASTLVEQVRTTSPLLGDRPCPGCYSEAYASDPSCTGCYPRRA